MKTNRSALRRALVVVLLITVLLVAPLWAGERADVDWAAQRPEWSRGPSLRRAAAAPAWLADCAAQLLARAVMEEARARSRAAGLVDPEPRPTPADIERARRRVLATLDELVALSGLDPRPFRQAHAPPAARAPGAGARTIDRTEIDEARARF